MKLQTDPEMDIPSLSLGWYRTTVELRLGALKGLERVLIASFEDGNGTTMKLVVRCCPLR